MLCYSKNLPLLHYLIFITCGFWLFSQLPCFGPRYITARKLMMKLRRERERERPTEISEQLFHSTKVHSSWGWAKQNQETRTQTRSPMWVSRTQLLEPLPAGSQGVHLWEICIRIGARTTTLALQDGMKAYKAASLPYTKYPSPMFS